MRAYTLDCLLTFFGLVVDVWRISLKAGQESSLEKLAKWWMHCCMFFWLPWGLWCVARMLEQSWKYCAPKLDHVLALWPQTCPSSTSISSVHKMGKFSKMLFPLSGLYSVGIFPTKVTFSKSFLIENHWFMGTQHGRGCLKPTIDLNRGRQSLVNKYQPFLFFHLLISYSCLP